MSMIDEKRYVLIPVDNVTDEMLQNTIPFSIHYEQTIVVVEAIEYELLKWRGDKRAELWSEFPVYSNMEIRDYINSQATLQLPTPQ